MEILTAFYASNILTIRADYDSRRTLPMLLEMMPGADESSMKVDVFAEHVVVDVAFETDKLGRAAWIYFKSIATR